MSTPLTAEPVRFEVTELRESARVRLRVRGELDLATTELLADRLRRLRERNAAVLLDLDELAFIDASGLRVVLDAAGDARRDGWAFTVTRGSAPVRRLFELLEVDEHLRIEAGPSERHQPQPAARG
jgi:anti-anti-sigma factor